MKLLVCISRTPETTAKISFTDNDTQFNTEGVQYILNPFDEWYALVRAIELKEKYGEGGTQGWAKGGRGRVKKRRKRERL